MIMQKLWDAYGKTLDFLRLRKRGYQLIHPAVIDDLARFCRASETTFHTDPRIHAMLEGRREVWLRIMQHRNHTAEELYALYGGKPINLTTETIDDPEA